MLILDVLLDYFRGDFVFYYPGKVCIAVKRPVPENILETKELSKNPVARHVLHDLNNSGWSIRRWGKKTDIHTLSSLLSRYLSQILLHRTHLPPPVGLAGIQR